MIDRRSLCPGTTSIKRRLSFRKCQPLPQATYMVPLSGSPVLTHDGREFEFATPAHVVAVASLVEALVLSVYLVSGPGGG